MGTGIGSLLSLVVSVFARSVGLDRDRAFYPTVLIVTASYYVLFAVMGNDPRSDNRIERNDRVPGSCRRRVKRNL